MKMNPLLALLYSCSVGWMSLIMQLALFSQKAGGAVVNSSIIALLTLGILVGD